MARPQAHTQLRGTAMNNARKPVAYPNAEPALSVLMTSVLQLLAKPLGVTQRPANGCLVSADAVLRPLVLLAIVLLVGPDLFAVVELTTLLDILGVTLFLLAYRVGLRSLTDPVLEWVKALFVPTEFLMLLNMRGQPVAIGFGVVFIVGHTLRLAALAFLSYAGIWVLMHSVT